MVAKKFKIEYAKLNIKQREAVDAIEGPVMVVAGPGTGKTTILTLRIANILLKTDTPASGILALTFTESGAKAMRAKLREIMGERALEVAIYTFHGFAASVIAEFGDHFPHLSRSKQITDIETEKLLRGILSQKKFSKLHPIGDPDFYIAKIIGAISDAKQEAWTPEVLKSFSEDEIERIKSDPEEVSSCGKSKGEMKAEALRRIEKCERTILFSYVYEAYENKKREEKKIDFDDLIFELLKTLREDKLLLQILQEKFLYILVDEHQDTNDAQNLIVRVIADFFDTPNLFVVGDEKQAIYRFQGASVENFLSFQKIWGGMKVISLTDNYRSHQHILDASHRMIEKNYGEKEHQNLRLKLRSGTKEKARPLDLILAPNTETEEAHLVKKLHKLLKNDSKIAIAIIVRKNSDVANIFSLLEENDIPASAERGANIFSHPVGALYFSLLEFLANPGNIEALAETFVGGLWGLDFQNQVKFIKLVRSGNLAEIQKQIPAIPKLQKIISSAGVIEYLILAADLSGFSNIASKSPLSAEVWRGIMALAEDLARASDIENPKFLIEELLAYKKSAERRAVKINTGQTQSQITIMTAHGSKGLEFDYVFLPYATEESWIRKNRGSYFVLPKEKEADDDIRDERRLFYVALTRAKKHICISYHREDNLSKTETPLRFIDELDQNLIYKTELVKTTKTNAPRSFKGREEKQNKEKVEYAKSALLENGLSVTALNHFMECPAKFFYKSILKLPEAPSASSEKGSAMHEALANVWRSRPSPSQGEGQSRKAGWGGVEQTITTSVQNYFKKSLLPLSEKETVLEELLANAPKVATALKDHFAQKGKVSVESWVETFFEHKKINLKLHGKLDALIEQGNKILVFDYKTREAMSVNAIKGETKNSDGNYFRQLVFYKMLLEDPERSRRVDKTIEPALVFIKPDSKNRCPIIFLPIKKSDIEKVKKEIEFLIESVWSGKLLTEICDNKDCQYCGYRKLTLQN
ncbi:MAG: ATP-dependent DNA helicase [Patescibacteria group bacterium]